MRRIIIIRSIRRSIRRRRTMRTIHMFHIKKKKDISNTNNKKKKTHDNTNIKKTPNNHNLEEDEA